MLVIGYLIIGLLLLLVLYLKGSLENAVNKILMNEYPLIILMLDYPKEEAIQLYWIFSLGMVFLWPLAACDYLFITLVNNDDLD